MHRFLEIILGLQRGFLSRQGEFALNFNPAWPGQATVGAATWNFFIGVALLALVIWVYRREGKSRNVRVTLGVLRAALLAFILLLLNRPVLTLGQSRTEPSVLAIMVDDSISMRVRDVLLNANAQPESRLAAAVELLNGDERKLIQDLSKIHQLRFFRFDSSAAAMPNESLAEALTKLEPTGQSTQLGESIRAALAELQGQRLAGVVLMTDGRDTPTRPLAETLAQLKDTGVKIYPVPLGSEQAPANIEVQSVNAEDAAFKGDIVNVKAMVRATGNSPKGNGQHEVTLRLRNKKSGEPLFGIDGNPVEQKITVVNDTPTETELQFKPQSVGPVDVVVEADKQAVEVDEEDNIRTAQVEVLDAKINVLYVDGYPRWEYRYIKNEMIRDQTVDISCLLTSADPDFRQEGDKPITRFPENMDELMAYDVVLFGDVDPQQQFSDAQLQLVADFVSKKAGGFGMVAGPRFSPQKYRNTAIEPILPVDISRVQIDDARASITSGFRPLLTKEGQTSSIFRFFADKSRNEKFFLDEIQPVFWYCRGISTKRGVGEVLAEHPTETSGDGRRAPILVLGHYGAGRTLFSAIDDSWRWRYYTGESTFDAYWVQQLRYLARSKRLGQRKVTFVASRPNYELGQQVQATLRVLDSKLIPQLPEQIGVEVVENGPESTTRPTTGSTTEPSTELSTGTVVRREMMIRQSDSPDTYQLSYTATRSGRFSVRLPSIGPGVDPIELPLDVSVPKLELAEPQVDRTTLSRLASETQGKLIEPAAARTQLVTDIPSAAKVIPLETNEPLWDAPIAMVLFVLLITCEWVSRKVWGMV